jgi:predicted Zn-dependent protease
MDVTSTMEEQYAKQATEEYLSQYASQILPPHHPLTLYVNSIVSSLLEASDLGHIARASDIPDGEFLPDDPGKKWNVIVIDDPKTVNAMATWGNVVVFTGILPICATPSGLAGVVGHEIAHVTLRHASETLSLMKAFNVLQIIFDVLGLDFVISRLFTTLVLE